MARSGPPIRALSPASTHDAAVGARVIAYHYGAHDFDVPPGVPVAFARDFIHVLRGSAPEMASELARTNPNRSVFRIGECNDLPDVVTACMTRGGRTALLKDSALVLSTALCVLLRPGPEAGDADIPEVLTKNFHPAGHTTDGYLFVREPTELRNNVVLRTWKLAFLCIAFGEPSCTLEYLSRARRHGLPAPMLRTYDRFLRELLLAMETPSTRLESLDEFDAVPPLEQRMRTHFMARLGRRTRGAFSLLIGRVPSVIAVPGMRTRELPAGAYWMLPRVLRPAAVAARRAQRASAALVHGIPVTESYRTTQAGARASPFGAKLEAYGFSKLAQSLRGPMAVR